MPKIKIRGINGEYLEIDLSSGKVTNISPTDGTILNNSGPSPHTPKGRSQLVARQVDHYNNRQHKVRNFADNTNKLSLKLLIVVYDNGEYKPMLADYIPSNEAPTEITGPEKWWIEMEAIPVGPLRSIAAMYKNPIKYTFMLYPRYVVGKFKYGFDTKLPTLFRAYKSEIPQLKNGKIQITPKNNRFIYSNGKESPIITNYTTDLKVLANNGGDWSYSHVYAIPGKKLLGQKVISTRPSDTFTFGTTLKVKPKDITIFSFDPEVLSVAKSLGIKTIDTSTSKINELIQSSLNLFKSNKNRFNLSKLPWDNAEVGRAVDLNERLLMRRYLLSPTTKDYKLMDYVFNPTYKSEIIPNIDVNTIKLSDLDKVDWLGGLLGNELYRSYLENPNLWKNVKYDPATPAESLFRKANNIILKSEYLLRHK